MDMFKTATALAAASVLALASPALAQVTADPLANISRDVSAVFNPGPQGQLLLSEEEHGVVTTRTLNVGDEYHDGWIIKTITGTSVALTRDDKTRTMAILGQRAGAAPVSIQPPAPSAVSG